jgi:ribosomal protein L7/L12
MTIMVEIVLGFTVAILILLMVFLNKKRNNPSRTGSTEQDITDALNGGNKVEAIKHYRHVHNVGLKDAKEAIEKLQGSP